MQELYDLFEKSLARFDEILHQEKTIANRDSAIKRFEFTVELAWKSMKTFLRGEGIICRSPKDCIRKAFTVGLIEDDDGWIAMLEDRNLTVHTYDEKTADDVYERLPTYVPLLQSLLKNLRAEQ